MSSEDNKAVSHRFIDEVANGGDLTAIGAIFAPDATYLLPGSPEPLRGHEGIRQFVTAFRTALPDYHGTIEEQVAEGDTVVTRVTGRGTNRGELMGLGPSGKAAVWSVVHISRFADGRIVEDRVIFDQLSFLQQLGHLPAPG